MTKRKTVKKDGKKSPTGKKQQPKVPPLVQEALQITWLLKGGLKNVQIAYIRVCKLLADVRDRKLWAELKHPDIEHYAECVPDGRSTVRTKTVSSVLGVWEKAFSRYGSRIAGA